eukprot:TRINITY_DN2961_c0_g1_i1.p1 TRINITY_DN2961_c0_g1~~TRINITY_DN2961_c0_g1_i1.p1  ORF type:complete len:596 (-),score=127.16 TRINITY_DN2961_c0_g1_i1:364-2151(-)
MSAVEEITAPLLSTPEQQLYEAVVENNPTKVMKILETPRIRVNWPNPNDGMKTALHAAAARGFNYSVILLLSKRAKVHLRDLDNLTPIQIALNNKHHECAKLMLERAVIYLERDSEESDLSDDDELLSKGRSTKSTLAPLPEVPDIGYEREDYGRRGADEHAPKNFVDALRIVHHKPNASLLTNMFKILHFQTIYNQWIAMLFVGIGSIIAQNYYETGKPVDFSFLDWCFGKMDIGVSIWIFMNIIVFLVFPLQKAITKGMLGMTLGYFVVYPIFLIVLLVAPTYFALLHKLPPATSLFVMCEQARFCMKIHSYLFTNRWLHNMRSYKKPTNPSQDDEFLESVICNYPKNLTIGDYIYYLFAPTLVYQTDYPRTKDRSLLRVAQYAIETLFSIFYAYVVFTRYCVPVFPETHGNSWEVALAIFKLMTPGMVMLLLANYGILHCWMNMWAEILYFADRQFYLDWWNTVSWSGYYRKWNIVVHKFLYRHIYMPCLFSMGYGKNGAMWMTFGISAVIHELILAVAFQYFLPILFILFTGPGVLFIYLTRGLHGNAATMRTWNIFMWMMLLIGIGMIFAAYARGWYFAHDYIAPTTSSE